MEKLIEFFQKSAQNFGNPTVRKLENSKGFDLLWDANPPLTLRWMWDDPAALRRDQVSIFSIGAAISGAHDHHAHVELSDPSHVWLSVSTRYQDFHGKVKANEIVRCLTKDGEYLKKALRAGESFLVKL
jgi:hypothetical protein